MGSVYSHETVKKLIGGEEAQVLKMLLSLDRIFETLCADVSDTKCDAGYELLARRQREENATGPELLQEQILIQCIGLWSVGVISSIDDLRAVVKLTLPVKLGEIYYQMLAECGVLVNKS